ncbi:MAG: VTT domain-containing protein [bacterium]|nr:MAG: VTT domain-containing protein [bacterium]
MDLLNLLDQIALLFEQWGYPIIFFGSLIEITPLGWAVPGGAILLVAGYLSNGNPNIPLIPIIVWGTLGTWVAFILAYILGSKTGMWLVNKLHQQKNASFAKRILKNNGPAILTTSMMANLTRFWISYIAGVEKYNLLKFNLYAFFASLSWVSMLVFLGYFAGYEKENLRKITSSIGVLAWIFLAIAIFVIFKSIKKEYKNFKEDEPQVEKLK